MQLSGQLDTELLEISSLYDGTLLISTVNIVYKIRAKTQRSSQTV